MKLSRKVAWSEYTERFDVEWRLDLGREVLPSGFGLSLTTGYVKFNYDHTKDGDFFVGRTEYTEEQIEHVEQDALKIMDAIKQEIRRARRNREKARVLTASFEFDVE